MQAILTKIGFGLSGTYLAAMTILLWGRLPQLLTMKLNEVGDFCAGVFGPLAILWLVLGYLQQGRELKLSTDALRMQAEELNNSVRQQEALVSVSRQQLEADLEEIAREREQRAQSLNPAVRVRAQTIGKGGNGVSYVFTFKNLGHDAEDFKAVLIIPNSSYILSYPIVLHRSEEVQSEVVIPDGASANLDITYMDGHGNFVLVQYNGVYSQVLDQPSTLEFVRVLDQ